MADLTIWEVIRATNAFLPLIRMTFCDWKWSVSMLVSPSSNQNFMAATGVVDAKRLKLFWNQLNLFGKITVKTLSMK